VAGHAARAAGGNLDRARLLVNDPDAAVRWESWHAVPGRLDGSGAAVASLVDELLAGIESAAAPLAERHEREAGAFTQRIEMTGERGVAGARKALEDRHRREVRRHRTDELRSGLAALSVAYRDRALRGGEREAAAAIDAVRVIVAASEALDRNPNETLLLQALFLRLPAA
jgi:DNA polymerase-3 subunit delta'